MSKTPALYCDDGERELPWHWEICPTCNGRGSHSLRIGAITADQRADWDPDEWEDYMNGLYDEACGCDHGKVRVVTRSSLSPADLAAWDQQLSHDEEVRQERLWESRMLGETDAWRDL